MARARVRLLRPSFAQGHQTVEWPAAQALEHWLEEREPEQVRLHWRFQTYSDLDYCREQYWMMTWGLERTA